MTAEGFNCKVVKPSPSFARDSLEHGFPISGRQAPTGLFGP